MSTGTFDIRTHLEQLEPAKEKGRYVCPVCGDDNFTVNAKNGAYQCWSSGCEPVAIRDAISPPIKGTTTRRKPTQRLKSTKEKNRDAQLRAAQIEAEVDHLAVQVTEGSETLKQALVSLEAWCKEHGHSAYNAGQLLKEKVKAMRPDSSDDPDEMLRIEKEYRRIEEHLQGRLRLNTLTKEVELDGQPFETATAKISLVVHHGLRLKGARNDIEDSVVMIAKANRYNPVVEYLDSVYSRHGDDTSILNGLTKRYLGTDDPLHETFLRYFLIAAVARAYKPGCKHDCTLILQGNQGYFKSTFFKVLASKPWFDDTFGDASDKDERLKMHKVWITEWAELENVFKRRDVSQVKAFLSCDTDRVRPPYGRRDETLPRGSVIVGTTNNDEFLTDPTGARRYWVIPV